MESTLANYQNSCIITNYKMAVTSFKSRARVIDLLGRQQIADVPTAIGELFKNALDAGARHAWVNLDTKSRILTIKDDGLGMRLGDVLDKWLILATESKHVKRHSEDTWLRFADEEQKKWCSRASYGEKGIGRLSIAQLGRMVVLWSVWGEGENKRGTLCLVHWHLFRHPTRLFEELPIPYAEYDHLPSTDEVASLLKEFRDHQMIRSLVLDEEWDAKLRADLQHDIDALGQLESCETALDLDLSWDMGTSFFIFGLHEEIDDLFRSTKWSDDLKLEDLPPDRLKAFHAFSTFWDPFHTHKDRVFEVIPSLDNEPLKSVNRFWKPEDFDKCDHHILIKVTENGFAQGYIKHYGAKKIVYERQLTSLPKGCVSPGAFTVEIGYLQGKKETTFVPEDIHTEINKRLMHAGGFSIYLNHVRVQPYGSIDSDFAAFEHRRVKNAGRYYFSTLRMFGGIFIPSKETTRLSEKAGREGFILNGASKGLRYWIIDLFIDIADGYLGRKSGREDKKNKSEEKRQAAAKERLKERKDDYLEKVRFARGWLRDFNGRIKNKIQQTRLLLSSESNAFPGILLNDCKLALNELRSELEALKETPGDPPYGIIVDGDAYAVVEGYITERGIAILNLEKEIASCSQKVQVAIARVENVEGRERGVRQRLIDVERDLRNRVSCLMKEATEKAGKLDEDLQNYERRAIDELIEARDMALEGLTAKKVALDETGKLSIIWESALQKQYNVFERNVAPRLRQLTDDLLHLTDETSSAFILSDQIRELQTLKDQHAFLMEMAQVGLVFETSSHEYNHYVNSINRAISLLDDFLPKEGKEVLNELASSFSIIDERIRLYDPLIRRKINETAEITGAEVETFLRRRLSTQLEGINLIVSEACLSTIWYDVKLPVFLGAVYNIVLNALFWCRKGASDACIKLSVVGKALTISDSGPGVNPRDGERIFEPGFSRKPNGRGLGLYIAREALRGIKYELIYSETAELGALSGANFTIFTQDDE